MLAYSFGRVEGEAGGVFSFRAGKLTLKGRTYNRGIQLYISHSVLSLGI